MKLSVIIPIYNVAPYISACLDSLLVQDIPASDYEIIIVDDGSIDDSLSIVQTYVNNKSNVYIYTQENAGPGAARNYGINKSKGEYIWFVDGDDKIETHCLKSLLAYIDRLNLDLCLCSYKMIYPDSYYRVGHFPYLSERVMTPAAILRENMFPVGVAFYIVRRDILLKNNLHFIPQMYHEDLEFNIRMVGCCERISYYEDDRNGLYHYVQLREGSTMTNPTVQHIKRRIEGYTRILQNIYSLSSENVESSEYVYYVHRLSNEIMVSFLFPLLHKSPIRNKASYYRNLIIENGLHYNLTVETGLSQYKFSLLSLFRSSYIATLLFLCVFNGIGQIRTQLRKYRV